MTIENRKTLDTASSMNLGAGSVTNTGSVAGTTSGSPRGNVSRRVLAASTLAGDRVRNPAGEDLGKIEELMLDLESGRVAYAVLSFGGFLGIGDKLFAVPWESLQLNHDEHEFVLDVEKNTLENAPGFDKDNWPNMADQSWGAQVHSHYGKEPYWSRTAGFDADDLASRTKANESGKARTFAAGTDERGSY